MRVDLLTHEHLAEARALLVASLPYDRLDVVAEEKLFGLSLVELLRDAEESVRNVLIEQSVIRAPIAAGIFEGGSLAAVSATSGRFVTLLAVRPESRGRGLATRLLAASRESAGKRRICGQPGNYLSPGIDVRYADASAFLEKRGFQALAEVENIRAPLDGNALISAERCAELDAAAEAQGYTVRRASDGDRDQLLAFIARSFAPVWAYEAALALTGPRQALHAAWFRGVPVAFAAADGNNRGLGWFGPAGTDPSHRGRGLGEALLIHCLQDVRGLPEGGVIAWIGPKAFYARSCGAVDDRRFRAWEQGSPA